MKQRIKRPEKGMDTLLRFDFKEGMDGVLWFTNLDEQDHAAEYRDSEAYCRITSEAASWTLRSDLGLVFEALWDRDFAEIGLARSILSGCFRATAKVTIDLERQNAQVAYICDAIFPQTLWYTLVKYVLVPGWEGKLARCQNCHFWYAPHRLNQIYCHRSCWRSKYYQAHKEKKGEDNG